MAVAIQSIIVELLMDVGYEVEIAEDGMEGISKFHQNKFSLILLDIMMPKIDGYTVCEMIRREFEYSDYYADRNGGRTGTGKSL